MKSRIGVVAIACGSALLAGCGGGGEGENAEKFSGEAAKVATVVDELQGASRDRDGERICEELFTERYAKKVSDEAKAPCVDRASKNLSNPEAKLTIEDLKVQKTTAVATVLEQDGSRSLLGLVKAGGDWRINAIGRAP